MTRINELQASCYNLSISKERVLVSDSEELPHCTLLLIKGNFARTGLTFASQRIEKTNNLSCYVSSLIQPTLAEPFRQSVSSWAIHSKGHQRGICSSF